MVTLSDSEFEDNVPAGALWALSGSIVYAIYLVALRRKIDHEDKLDIPMFFGKLSLNSVQDNSYILIAMEK